MTEENSETEEEKDNENEKEQKRYEKEDEEQEQANEEEDEEEESEGEEEEAVTEEEEDDDDEEEEKQDNRSKPEPQNYCGHKTSPAETPMFLKPQRVEPMRLTPPPPAADTNMTGNPTVVDEALQQVLNNDPELTEVNLNNIDDISQVQKQTFNDKADCNECYTRNQK